jgi:hypothetical protein
MQITTTTSRPANITFLRSTFAFISISAYFYTAFDIHNCLNGYVGDVSQKQAETKSANDHSSAKPSSVSVAASRLERLTMHQERYKYLPPAPSTNHYVRDELCADSAQTTTHSYPSSAEVRNR